MAVHLTTTMQQLHNVLPTAFAAPLMGGFTTTHINRLGLSNNNLHIKMGGGGDGTIILAD